MKQYSLKGTNGNEARFVYNDYDLLVEFKFEQAEVNHETNAAIMWLHKNLPSAEYQLKALATKYKMELVEIPVDLSFDTFWNTYNHKLGGKDRARKLWEKLPDADKVKALASIPRYNTYLKIKNGIEKAYPETYLSQRRFENSFR